MQVHRTLSCREHELEIGDVVAVKVYRTQAWHRAKIIENFQHPKLGDSFRVNLLDKVSFMIKKLISGVRFKFYFRL